MADEGATIRGPPPIFSRRPMSLNCIIVLREGKVAGRRSSPDRRGDLSTETLLSP